MATKKSDVNQLKNVIPEEVDAEMINAATEMPEDPWLKNREIVVPRKPRGEDQQYYICINDRRFLVPADGKVQSLPDPVAEVLLASIQAEVEADVFAEHIPNRAGEQPSEHPI